MNTRLGGDIDTLGMRDVLSSPASLGNPYKKGGGYAKSPLAGSQLGAGQLNHLNLPKNDVVDPLELEPDAQTNRPVVLPANSVIAVTVAELTLFDPGVGTGGSAPAPQGGEIGAGDGAGASSDGVAGGGPAGGGGPGGTGSDGGDGGGGPGGDGGPF